MGGRVGSRTKLHAPSRVNEAGRPVGAHRAASIMATTSKQYKAIGEDIWKGRAEKIVRRAVLLCGVRNMRFDLTLVVERRAVCLHVRRTGRAAHPRL